MTQICDNFYKKRFGRSEYERNPSKNKNCDSLVMFNANFNNKSIISWQSVLLAEETGVFGEKHQSVVSH